MEKSILTGKTTDKNSVHYFFDEDYKINETVRKSGSYGDFYVTRISNGFRVEFPDEYILRRAEQIQRERK